MPAIELTLTTPGTVSAIPRLIRDFPTACIGVGTVTNPDQAYAAAAAGAKYLVTPTVSRPVADAARRAGVPLLMGALTPTEALEAWRAGASAVKIFPAATVGPSYLAQLRGPFPDLEVVPSGGIGVDAARAWITAGACAVSIDGPLLGDALVGGDLSTVTERAAALVAAVQAARTRS